MVTIGQLDFPRSQFDVRVGRRLCRARSEARYTQEEAAEVIGVSPDTVSKWERGIRRPSLEKLRNAARLYGVSVGFFVD
jgi:transcriptional regulator with XRE-family HTH domain